MSGVYIPNMEMPKTCADCRLFAVNKLYNYVTERLEKHAFCTANHSIRFEEFDIDNIRHESCPLVELPSHGRLGDLDALSETIDSSAFWDSGDLSLARDIVKYAPTIIEASKEK